MGSIFGRTAVLQPYTPKPRYVPQTAKREESIQKRVCSYLRKHYPDVDFMSDYAAGVKLSKSQAGIRKSLQSGRSWPDMFIAWPSTVMTKSGERKRCAGLFLELKDEGTELKMRRNGTKIRVVRRNGVIIERDYKIRQKGDWASLHVERQAEVLDRLRQRGFCALFAIGYDDAIRKIDWYMGNESLSLF